MPTEFDQERPTEPDLKKPLNEAGKVDGLGNDLMLGNVLNGDVGSVKGYVFAGEVAPQNAPHGKLDAKLIRDMVATIQRGNFPDTAAIACGVSLSAYYEWKQRAAKGEEPYATWNEAIARACAVSEIDMVDQVRSGDEKGAGFGPAKAALELLGRRNPKRWSQQVRVEVADQLNQFICAAEKVCDPTTFQKLLEALAEEQDDS